MWRPGKNKTSEPQKKPLLPPSRLQLQHAKADRELGGTFFRDLHKTWKTVVRPRVEAEAPAAAPDDPKLPAYLRHRPTGNTPPLFYRTKAAARTKRP